MRPYVVPSVEKIFSGRSDAAMWRDYAYARAGLTQRGIQTRPQYPPRKITIIDRKGFNGRGIYNLDEVVAAVAAEALILIVSQVPATKTVAAGGELSEVSTPRMSRIKSRAWWREGKGASLERPSPALTASTPQRTWT